MIIRAVSDYAPCVALRRAVFIEEQQIAEADEIDELDGEAIHLLATVADVPVGTARLLIRGNTGKIGRVCVLASHRGTGLGKALIMASIAELQKRPGITRAKLSAQDHAIDFYAALGFIAEGPFYDDAGIPHKDMVRPLTAAANTD